MNLILQPWHLLVVILAGWINRPQQTAIDFQNAQIQVMMERLGKKAHPPDGRSATPIGCKRQDLRTEGLAGTNHHRDSKFSEAFRNILQHANVEPVMVPPGSPNLNPHIERFMRSIKDECLNKTIFFSERSLRKAVKEFCLHYHLERNHQGLNNKLLQPGRGLGRNDGKIACGERLGGILKYYYRNAT